MISIFQVCASLFSHEPNCFNPEKNTQLCCLEKNHTSELRLAQVLKGTYAGIYDAKSGISHLFSFITDASLP